MEDAGVGHARGGHLDPDELGRVEESAVDLDSADTARGWELVEGPDGWTWGERLEAAGVAPFLRRHRVALTGVAASVLIVGGLAAAYVAGLPPEDDRLVAVEVWDSTGGSGEFSVADREGTLQFSYDLTPQRPGDSVRLLGLAGPGVRESSGARTEVAGRSAGLVDAVVVIPGCDDPAILTATEADYFLRVARTDALGRTAVDLVEVPWGSAAQWSLRIGSFCTQRWFDERITTEGVHVAPGVTSTGVPALDLGLRLHNGVARDVLAVYGDYYGRGRTPRSVATLVRGATTELSISLPVVDCRNPKQTVPGAAGGVALAGFLVRPERPGAPLDDLTGEISVAWSADAQRRIDAALRSLCAGTPPVEVGIVSATPTSNVRLLVAQMYQGGNADAVLRTAFRVTTSASRVTISDPVSGTEDGDGSPIPHASATARVRGGTAVLAIDWAVSCEAATGPPQLQLSLASRGRSYPVRVELVDPTFAAGYLRVCPNLSAADLRDQGWPVAG